MQMSLPGWVPDEDADECMVCDTSFSLTFRKHHCRFCGYVVCDGCSLNRLAFPGLRSSNKLRICDPCFEKQTNSKHASSNQASDPQAIPYSSSSISNSASSSLSSRHESMPGNEIGAVGSTPSSSPIPTGGYSDSKTSSQQSVREQEAQHASANVESGSSSSGAQSELKRQHRASITSFLNHLDVPLRLCMAILKCDPEQMLEKYQEYLTIRKTRSTQENYRMLLRQQGTESYAPLSFRQFVYFKTIRIVPNFVFKKTSLAFRMMRSSSHQEDKKVPLPFGISDDTQSDADDSNHDRSTADAGTAQDSESVLRQRRSSSADYFPADETDHATAKHSTKKRNSTPHSHGNLHHHVISNSGVKKEQFLRYSRILVPIASTMDCHTVFEALRNPRDNQIHFNEFKAYVESLQKSFGCIEHDWKDSPSHFNFHQSEDLLLIRERVADTTTFPPSLGRLGITSHHLLFETLFNTRHKYRWKDVIKVENMGGRMLPRNSLKLTIRRRIDDSPDADLNSHHAVAAKGRSYSSSSSKELKDSDKNSNNSHKKLVDKNGSDDHITLVLDFVGLGSDVLLEKSRTFVYIMDILLAQRLTSHIEDTLIAQAIIHETCDTIHRMWALEKVDRAQPLLLSPFHQLYTRHSKPGGKGHINGDKYSKGESYKVLEAGMNLKQAYDMAYLVDNQRPIGIPFVDAVANVVRHARAVQQIKSHWIYHIFPKLEPQLNKDGTDDIDPEMKLYEEVNRRNQIQEVELEPFSISAFSHNVKLFLHVIQPIILFLGFAMRILDWEYPLATIWTMLVLLNMAYQDLLPYVPALLMFIHTLLLIALNFRPNLVEETLGADLSNDPRQADQNDKDEEGLWQRLLKYKNVAIKTRDGLENAQHSLQRVNLQLQRLEGLYKWKSLSPSLQWFLVSLLGSILLYYVPFRVIFPFLVLDIFTSKFQRDGSYITYLLRQVAVPTYHSDSHTNHSNQHGHIN